VTVECTAVRHDALTPSVGVSERHYPNTAAVSSHSKILWTIYGWMQKRCQEPEKSEIIPPLNFRIRFHMSHPDSLLLRIWQNARSLVYQLLSRVPLSWMDLDCNPNCIPVPEDQAAHLTMLECACHLNLV
jgi:hypothetical protein